MKQTYIRRENIKQNTVITPQDYYGYIAHNNGVCDVMVDGVLLHQGDKVDLSALPTDSILNTPISIIFGTNDTERDLCMQLIKITDK